MATMTLRIGSKRNKNQVVSAVIHSDRKEMHAVRITGKLLKEAGDLIETGSVCCKNDIEAVIYANSVEDQLQSVKNIGKTVLGNCSENVEMPDFVIRLFTELYLLSPAKNPLKSAIAKLFLTFPEKYHQNICSCIANGITDLISSATVYGDLQKLNSTTTAIMCLFDNSSLGQDVMSYCVPKVLQFFHNSLIYYILHLSKELSPVERMEVCQYVHNTARGSVTILQKCQTQVAEMLVETSDTQKLGHPDLSTCISYLLESPSLCSNPQDKINNKIDSNCAENSSIIKELQEILQLMLALVGYPELPMDTNFNCGLVAVLIMLRFWKNEEQDIKNIAPWDADLSSDICKLSFCSGLLNALTAEELVQIHPKTNEYNIIYIYHQLHGISKRSGADSALVLGVSRAMQLLSRNLCTLPVSAAAMMKSQLIHGLLEFIWIHLEHYMDSVRHAATATLQNVVKLSSVLQRTADKDSRMLSTILDAVMQLPVDRKSKYIGIATLGNEIGCQALIDRAPNIVPDLLHAMNDTTMITYVSSAIENLMIQHKNECSDEVWKTVWIRPLLKTMSTVSSMQRHVLQSLLAKVVTLNPDIVAHMLPSDSCLIETNTSQLRTLLLCLCLAHKQGAFDSKSTSPKNSEEECHSQKWKGMFDLLMLKKMLFHQDDEIRIAALSLIVESHRSTEAFSSAELQLLKTFLEYNINTHVPSERQRMLALYKKALTRLKDSGQALLRNVRLENDKRTTNQIADAHTSEEQLLQKYSMFLHWLVDFCFISLFPGANFGRRCSSLQILTLIKEIIGFTSEVSTWVPVATVVYTESNANVLWECLKDTYENNKILAFHLLVTFPAEALGLDEIEQVKSLVKVCLALISSHRPPDCITAAYILRVLVRYSQTSLALEEELAHNAVLAASKELDGVREPTVYLVVGVLLRHLSYEAENATQSLLMAAASGPMYGTLFCIRHLLSDVDLLFIAHNKCWRDLFKEVVSLCFKLNEIVGPVVNSSSPEGHLPMDFQPGAEHLSHPDEAMNKNKPVLNVTAQMVLLCSWRTVKEVSLFLGELVERAPITCNEDIDSIGLLTESQVLEIGAHLATLLAETKHRGAFEQAYVGFCKLCSRLWRHSSPKLHQLPQCWLHQLMDAIAHGKGTKLCATRRSAGLPFMVQALVTTELQVGGNPTCFQQSMNTLLELADSDKESDHQTQTADAEDAKIWSGALHSSILQTNCATEIIFNWNILQKSADELQNLDDEKNLRVEAHTHASNILRALFKHSALGELVTPYVAQGLIVAIRGFKCKTWAERNSATLLFSALVTRIFGVSRSKDEISIRNRMTGRIFFQHYPVLYDFLLQELKEAVTRMEQNGTMLQPALYPVLLILARLYPSSLEGTDSNLQLSAYAPYVHCCSLSLVAKIRILASKALVPLLSPSQHVALLKELFAISGDKDTTQNQRHGLLLQAYHLLEHILGVKPVNSRVLREVEQGIENLIWLLPNGSHTEVCLITAEVYLRILHIVAVNSFSSITVSVWEKIYQNMSLSDVEHSKEELSLGTLVGQSVYLHNEAQVYLELSLLLKSTFPMNEDFINYMEKIVLHHLCHKEYNVTLVILNFLYAVVSTEYAVIKFEDSTLPVEMGFHNRIRQWNVDHNGILESMLKQSSKIGKMLANQAMDKSPCTYQECKQWTFLVLSNYPEAFLCFEAEPEIIMKNLLDLCEEESESVSWTVLSCAASLMNMLISRNINIPAVMGNRFCGILYKFSTSDMSLLHRLTVACIVTTNYTWLLKETPAFTVSGVCTLWTVVMLLLDDDASQVRDLVTELALKLDCIDIPVISQKARELLLEQFVALLEDADAVACAATLFLWCLGPAICETVEDISEDRVFDKAEMNVFAEAATLSELASNSLKKLIKHTNAHQLLEESLTLEMKDWFVQMCWRNHNSDSEGNGLHTLLDFAKEFEKHSEISVKECNKAACFVVPNEAADILKLYQLRRLLESISVSETHNI